MGNFYEIIQTMEDGDIIETRNGLDIKKFNGYLYLVDHNGVIDSNYGKNGHAVDLDNYNKHTWSKKVRYHRIDIHQAISTLRRDEYVYVGDDKVEISQYRNFKDIDVSDIYDLVECDFYTKG